MYRIIDDCGTEIFDDEVFDDLNEAIAKAKSEWEHLSEHDKKRRQAFFVAEDEEDGYEPIAYFCLNGGRI